MQMTFVPVRWILLLFWQGMENIMLVIEEHVMPMMMDAVVRVATEMTEANRSSVIEDMFSKVEEQKKKLQFCFGSKLYPDAVRMAPQFPAITCTIRAINFFCYCVTYICECLTREK